MYVVGGGRQSDGHYQTPKPMNTANTIVKSLTKTYREDFLIMTLNSVRLIY